MDPKVLLLASLVVIVLFYALYWWFTVKRQRAAGAFSGNLTPQPIALVISFIANFFDTLGIGSYATTTSMFRFWNVVRDEKIPGTLNVGYVLPTGIRKAQAPIMIGNAAVGFIPIRLIRIRHGA